MKKKLVKITGFISVILIVYLTGCGKSAERIDRESSSKTVDEAPSSAPADYEQGKIEDQSKSGAPSKKSAANEKSKATTGQDNFAKVLDLISATDTTFLEGYNKGKKLIRSAELRFKVKNVESATYQVENIIRKYNGFIIKSDITSNKIQSTLIPISSDSLKEIYSYNVSNEMDIRIPYYNLDSALAEISRLFIYLDYRKVKAEDVTTNFIRNKLRAQNKEEYQNRIKNAVDEKGRRLNDIVYAEGQALSAADQMIEDKIANYTLQDRVNYSSIYISMYQNSKMNKEIVPDNRVYQYEPSISMRFKKAFTAGWEILISIFVGFSYLWSLILLGVILYFLIKFLIKKFKKKQNQ